MGFPVLAKNNRARLVILNRDPTGLDELADLVINADIGTVMSAAARQAKRITCAKLARPNATDRTV